MIYAFWNNKGGTGKTSLSFQTITMYAKIHKKEKILALLCQHCPGTAAGAAAEVPQTAPGDQDRRAGGRL